MTYRFDFAALAPDWPDFLEGVWLTLHLAVLSTVLGFVLGTLCAVARASGTPWVRRLVGADVEAIRNTPLLLQIVLVDFGLATLGFRIPANVAAVTARVVNVAAYTCEIVRAGLESVHANQREAAECLGLDAVQTDWPIIIRPAIERVYPALTSQCVLLMLATSIASQISAEELTAVARRAPSTIA